MNWLKSSAKQLSLDLLSQSSYCGFDPNLPYMRLEKYLEKVA